MVLAVTWLVVASAVALLLGPAIRLAAHRVLMDDGEVLLPDDLTVEDVLACRPAPSH